MIDKIKKLFLENGFKQEELDLEFEKKLLSSLSFQPLQKIILSLLLEYKKDVGQFIFKSLDLDVSEILLTEYFSVNLLGKAIFKKKSISKESTLCLFHDKNGGLFSIETADLFELGRIYSFKNLKYSKKKEQLEVLALEKLPSSIVEGVDETQALQDLFKTQDALKVLQKTTPLFVVSWNTKEVSLKQKSRKIQDGLFYSKQENLFYTLTNWTSYALLLIPGSTVEIYFLKEARQQNKEGSKKFLFFKNSFFLTSETRILKNEVPPFRESQEISFEKKPLSVALKENMYSQNISFAGRILLFNRSIYLFRKCSSCNRHIDYCDCTVETPSCTEVRVIGTFDDTFQKGFFNTHLSCFLNSPVTDERLKEQLQKNGSIQEKDVFLYLAKFKYSLFLFSGTVTTFMYEGKSRFKFFLRKLKHVFK